MNRGARAKHLGCPRYRRLVPGRHHVDVAAVARRADEPLALLGNSGLGPVALGHLGSIEAPVA